MTSKIYTLTDPLNDNIFYVGLTREKRLNARLIIHICEARRHPFSPKNLIINNIIKENLKPIIELLDEIPLEERGWQPIWDSQKVETYWIHQLLAWGFNLSNTQKKPA